MHTPVFLSRSTNFSSANTWTDPPGTPHSGRGNTPEHTGIHIMISLKNTSKIMHFIIRTLFECAAECNAMSGCNAMAYDGNTKHCEVSTK